MDVDVHEIPVKLMRTNFIDPDTKEEIFVQKYSIVFRPDGVIYIDKATNKQIVNKKGKPFVHIEEEGDFNAKMGSSVATTKVKLNKYLKKRAKDHFKKDVLNTRNQMINSSTPKQS